MYKKVRCTCKIVVWLIKPIAFVMFPLPSPSSDLKVLIKRRGPGISPGYYERLPRLLSKENKRKIEPKEIPSCLIPRPLVVFTRQLEILVTTLSGTSNMALLFFPHLLSFPRTSSCFPVNSVWASFLA